MSLMDMLFGRKPKTADVARDRLQIIIAQERVKAQAPDYLPTLQKELLCVIEIRSCFVGRHPHFARKARRYGRTRVEHHAAGTEKRRLTP